MLQNAEKINTWWNSIPSIDLYTNYYVGLYFVVMCKGNLVKILINKKLFQKWIDSSKSFYKNIWWNNFRKNLKFIFWLCLKSNKKFKKINFRFSIQKSQIDETRHSVFLFIRKAQLAIKLFPKPWWIWYCKMENSKM